jgi:anti-sigma factor RsiW
METRLIAYLDGRAAPAERRAVEEHLAACAACRARAEEFRALWSVLDEAPALDPSPAFDARLRARLAAEPPPHPFAWLLPSPRLALAMSLLLLLSVWMATVPPASLDQQPQVARSEEEFKMIRDLQLLEDYDVLADFEALSALPTASASTKRTM